MEWRWRCFEPPLYCRPRSPARLAPPQPMFFRWRFTFVGESLPSPPSNLHSCAPRPSLILSLKRGGLPKYSPQPQDALLHERAIPPTNTHTRTRVHTQVHLRLHRTISEHIVVLDIKENRTQHVLCINRTSVQRLFRHHPYDLFIPAPFFCVCVCSRVLARLIFTIRNTPPGPRTPLYAPQTYHPCRHTHTHAHTHKENERWTATLLNTEKKVNTDI